MPRRSRVSLMHNKETTSGVNRAPPHPVVGDNPSFPHGWARQVEARPKSYNWGVWDPQMTLNVEGTCLQGWALSGPTSSWVHMGACLGQACLQPCRSLIKASECVCLYEWPLVDGRNLRKGHPAREQPLGFDGPAAASLLPTPHLLAPRRENS